MAHKSQTGKTKKSKSPDIRRANDMRVRIQTYCRQKGLTQAALAALMDCTTSQMANFMSGTCLVGSNVYIAGLSYLRTRMPIGHCSQEDRDAMKNNKWGWSGPKA